MTTKSDGRKISARDYDAADLSLRALRVFLAVEEAGSIVVAAERLQASKSTVSQQVTNLEEALGSALFDRSARPMTLTPAGMVLRRHAHEILNAVSAARLELMEMNLSTMAELRLGIVDDLDASITPDLVAHLSTRYPQCLFTASSGLSDDLTTRLVDRKSDIVLTADPPRDPQVFDVMPLLREPYVLVTAKGTIDCDGELLPQLTALPFVRYNAAMPIGRSIEQQLRRIRLSPVSHFAFDASRSVFAMVQKSGGWAMTTPLCVLDSERFRGSLEVRPLPFPGLTRTLTLVARRDELGTLPADLARLCRDLLKERLMPAALDMAPWLEGAFRVLDEGAVDPND